MKRRPQTTLDIEAGRLPPCFVLAPDTDEDRAELSRAFEEAGVRDGADPWWRSELSVRLHVPADFNWMDDGSVRIDLTAVDNPSPPTAYFWVVECDDGSGRRFVWWRVGDDQVRAEPWRS